MSSKSSQDREDRMLAYYIRLIEQQEREHDKPSSRRGRKMSDMSEASMKSESVSSRADRTEPPEETPSKKMSSAKLLAQAEAERIISTIMERRPGRAEFVVPDNSRKRRKSGTEDSPPKNTSVVEVEPFVEEKPVVAPEAPAQEPLPKEEVKELVVQVVEKRRPGRPPKNPKPLVVEAPAEPVPPPPAATKKLVPAEEPEGTLRFKWSENGQMDWWRKTVSLIPIDYESELAFGLALIESDLASTSPPSGIFPISFRS